MKKLTTSQRNELAELLARFGLGEAEQRAYLALRSLGPTSLSPVAAELGKPVSTVQSIMHRLVKIGIVDVTLRKSRKIFQVSDPTRFTRLAERQLQDASHLIGLLKMLDPEQTAFPAKVRVYSRERITDIFHRILESKSKHVCEIVSAQDIQEIVGERFHFTKRRVAKGIKLKSLRVETHEIKRYSREAHARELREARFLPAGTAFHASLACWDDMIALYPVRQEGLAVVIQSASLSAMLRELFEILWSISRRMETA